MKACTGSGRPGVGRHGSVFPHCAVCGREFSAQGRKARAKLGDPWKAIPRHYVEE